MKSPPAMAKKATKGDTFFQNSKKLKNSKK